MEHLQEIHRLQKLAGIAIRENYNRNMGLSSLYEADVPSDDAIEKSFEATFGKEVLDKLESGEEIKNELVAGLLFSIFSLLPWLSSLSGKAVNAMKERFGSFSEQDKTKMKEIKAELKKLKDLKNQYDKENNHQKETEVLKKIKELEHSYDKQFGSKIGNWFKESGEKLHHVYVTPFKKGLDWLAGKISDERASKNTFLKRLKEDERFRENLANIGYCITSMTISAGLVLSDIPHIVETLHSATGLATTVIIYIIKAIKQGKKSGEIFKAAAEMI